MPDRYITLSDAEKFTGKSRSTLRRFLDGIVKVDDAPDRHLITPTIDEVAAFREENQPFTWKISEELLRRQFLKSEETDQPSEEGSGPSLEGGSNRLVSVLEKTVAMFEKELNEKNAQIAALNERLRESNYLQQDLQARLALPPAKPREMPVDAETTRTESKKTTRIPFGWLFGR